VSPRLPRLTADALIRAISKIGHPKLVQAAVRDTGLSLEEFLKLL